MSVRLQENAEASDLGWNADFVDVLAGLFIGPLPLPVVENYRSGLGAVLLETLSTGAGCAAGVGRMQVACGGEQSTAALTQTLSMAFSRLFDGAGGAKTVSLYESGHVSASGRLFQEPVGAMDKLLRVADVSVSAGTCEPPDHLSIELALLAQCLRGRDRDTEARWLLDAHLLQWVPPFAEQCIAADPSGFYAGAADVLAQTLSALRETLRAPVSARVIVLHSARPAEDAKTTGAVACPTE